MAYVNVVSFVLYFYQKISSAISIIGIIDYLHENNPFLKLEQICVLNSTTCVFGSSSSRPLSRGNGEFPRESYISLRFKNHVPVKELFPRVVKIFLGKEKKL
jgi:hypothetical protein